MTDLGDLREDLERQLGTIRRQQLENELGAEEREKRAAAFRKEVRNHVSRTDENLHHLGGAVGEIETRLGALETKVDRILELLESRTD